MNINDKLKMSADVFGKANLEGQTVKDSAIAVSDSQYGQVDVRFPDGSVVTIPTIAPVEAGENVDVIIREGVATCLGASGWGDGVQQIAEDAYIAASEAAATAAYVTRVETGDDAGVHVHENEDNYNIGGDFWINPNLAQIKKNGQMMAEFSENGAKFCGGKTHLETRDNIQHPRYAGFAFHSGNPANGGYVQIEAEVDATDPDVSYFRTWIKNDTGSADLLLPISGRPTLNGQEFAYISDIPEIPEPPSFEPVLLWSGNWNSGSITVPNFTDYHRYIVYVGTENVPLEASRTDTHNRVVASASYSTSTPYLYIYTGSFSYSGNVLTYLHAAYSRLDNHAITKQAITEIWGVL